jgi:hypothetical protein
LGISDIQRILSDIKNLVNNGTSEIQGVDGISYTFKELLKHQTSRSSWICNIQKIPGTPVVQNVSFPRRFKKISMVLLDLQAFYIYFEKYSKKITKFYNP